MIRIRRGAESTLCPELAAVRVGELERVRGRLAAGATLSQFLVGTKYDVAKETLYAMQHYKCCYCEARLPTQKWNQVEHFRPKVEVLRGDETAPGYWWLTWTWENLLFSCQICNHRKDTGFPLAEASTPLAPEEQPSGEEQALLIDPSDRAEDDPRAHIQFRPVGGTWLPFPRYGSRRGQAVIEALQLYHPKLDHHRRGLLSQWRAHSRMLEDGPLQAVRTALAHEDRDQILTVWRREVRPRLFSNQAFVALSIDVFDHYVPAQTRARWGLELDVIELPPEALVRRS